MTKFKVYRFTLTGAEDSISGSIGPTIPVPEDGDEPIAYLLGEDCVLVDELYTVADITNESVTFTELTDPQELYDCVVEEQGIDREQLSIDIGTTGIASLEDRLKLIGIDKDTLVNELATEIQQRLAE